MQCQSRIQRFEAEDVAPVIPQALQELKNVANPPLFLVVKEKLLTYQHMIDGPDLR
jgi:hypothetical protein